MAVTIKKRGTKWYVYVNYQGRRKNRCIGTREAAERVRRELEARLALGDSQFLDDRRTQIPLLKEYAHQWLSTHAALECKPSTRRSYEQLLRVHVLPRFGQKRIDAIKRDEVKRFLIELSQATRNVGEPTLPRFSKNTLRLIMCSLRTVLNAALEDGLIETNPASRIGKFLKSEKPAQKARAMTREEAERFLDAIQESCPSWYPFFLTALRAGLRKGELIALKWGDIQFGESARDSNRYILVERNYAQGQFTSPKSKKSRRVDLSKQLRAALIELRDARLLAAMMSGEDSIAGDLVFPSQAGTVLKPDNIAPRYMDPALTQAGLGHFRFHDLRHTFGSLLIQDGASLAYVKEQMGHSSIQITVDTYGHLIPGDDIAWVDRLDSVSPVDKSAHQSAPGPHQAPVPEKGNDAEVVEKIWRPPGIRTPIC